MECFQWILAVRKMNFVLQLLKRGFTFTNTRNEGRNNFLIHKFGLCNLLMF